MINLTKVSTNAFGGALCGLLIGGVGLRVAMRIVALITTGSGSFSGAGTLLILILATLVGIPLGLLFGAVRQWLPGGKLTQGAIYGAFWALLFASLFFLSPEGEFGLLPPWQGAIIFAPVWVLLGIGLSFLADTVSRPFANRPPQWVNHWWFALFLISFVLAFVGMTSLSGQAIRLPRAVSEWSGGASVNFGELYERHRLLGLLFLLAWCGTASAIFFSAAATYLGRLAAVALLLFAAGWFNVEGLAATIFEPAGWVDLLSWLLRLIGVAALLILLAEVVRSYTQAIEANTRRQLRPVLVGIGIAVGWFVVLSIATFFVPALTFRNGEIFAPLAVTVYLVPWLALPIALVYTARQDNGVRG